MGWPKGVPRKGYVKKDGTPHAEKGTVLAKADPAPVAPKPEEVEESTPYALHGMVGTSAITEPCPLCMYAYADGGYCPECGWSRAITVLPYGGAGSGKIGG